MMNPFVSLIRPAQWLKNIVVLMPPFFAGMMLKPEVWAHCAAAFVCFCLASSAVYCVNDIVDRNADSRHPLKRNRPVASGRVSVTEAGVAGALCALMALSTAVFLMPSCRCEALTIIVIYLVMNLAYCLRVKQMAVIDVFFVAAGYVMRLLMGGAVSDVHLSPWIVMVTLLFTMFLTMAKRRCEVVIRESGGAGDGRVSTRAYTLPYVNVALAVLAAATMVSYIIYTVSPDVTSRLDSEYVYVSSMFVLLGLLRYLQLSIVDGKGDNPVALFVSDGGLMFCAAGWLLTFIVIIYC